MTIPNLITIARLFMVPLVIVMIGQERWGLAFLVFAAAGISDGIDGYIARRFDMRSEFGAYIDPVADKALLVSIYVSLSLVAVIPGWLTVMVVSRDVMIVGAVIISWLMARPLEIKPLWISKLNTVAQIGFAALVLGARAFTIDLGDVAAFAAWTVAALTLASAGAYLAPWLRHMAAEEEPRR